MEWINLEEETEEMSSIRAGQ